MKLKDETILILGATRFDECFESTSFTTAKYFARENDVFYIDYPFTWKDLHQPARKEQMELRKEYFGTGTSAVISTDIERLKVIVPPPVLSINFLPESFLYRWLLAINEKRIAGKILKVMDSLAVKNFIFINSFNFHYPRIAKYIQPKLAVYQCVDPLIIPYDRKHGVESEKWLTMHSDAVVCTSRQLYAEKLNLNPNTYFIPNAADLAHSQQAMSPLLPLHPLLKDIPAPVIGYFGNIERRMDYSLLTEVIRSNKDKSFVLAGAVAQEYITEEFRSLSNLHFTGQIPFSEMPSMIKGFDVCIIPFKKDKVSATIFPLKLFEYLGTGKPVVATDFNLDLKEYTLDTVSFSSNADAFTAALEEALTADSVEKRERRLAVAAENTWDKRLGQFSSLLQEFLQKTSLPSN